MEFVMSIESPSPDENFSLTFAMEQAEMFKEKYKDDQAKDQIAGALLGRLKNLKKDIDNSMSQNFKKELSEILAAMEDKLKKDIKNPEKNAEFIKEFGGLINNIRKEAGIEQPAVHADAIVANILTKSTENTIDVEKGKSIEIIRDFIKKVSPNALLRTFAMPMVLRTLNTPHMSPDSGNEDIKVEVKIGKKVAVLNTYERKPDSFKKMEPKDQKFIIHFCGNNQFAGDKMSGKDGKGSQISEPASKNVERFGCGVITFDYPGVGIKSGEVVKATKTKQLVNAGIAQVQRLLDQNVKPENIVLDGISLGGAVATLTAAHFHKKGLKVHLINERSFGKLSAEGTAMASKEFTGILAVLKPLAPFISPIIKLTGLEMEPDKAYKSIDDEFKTCLFADKDEVIAFEESFAKAVGDGDDPDKCLVDCKHGTDLSKVQNKKGVPGDLLKVQLLARALNQQPDLVKAPVPSSLVVSAPTKLPTKLATEKIKAQLNKQSESPPPPSTRIVPPSTPRNLDTSPQPSSDKPKATAPVVKPRKGGAFDNYRKEVLSGIAETRKDNKKPKSSV